MKYRLRILPAAIADIRDNAKYIAKDRVDAALRFYEAVDLTKRQLSEHPNRWPDYDLANPKLANIRRRAVIGFGNYLVIYRVEKNVITVMRILHGARDIPSILEDDLAKE